MGSAPLGVWWEEGADAHRRIRVLEKGFCKFKMDKVELPPLRENEFLRGKAGIISIHADGPL